MNEVKHYSIKRNRLKNACMSGFHLEGDTLVCDKEQTVRTIFLGALDSTEENMRWGRFTLTMSLGTDMVCSVHVMASDYREFIRKDVLTGMDSFLQDSEVPAPYKQSVFELSKEQVFVDQEDFLLYDLQGRYLWFYLEVFGEGEGSIRDMHICIPGDNFMNSYPEVYREWGSFFHRYLSVFSSIYNDFHKDIKNVGEKLTIDTAPAELLPVFASWMGIDVSGNFLEEASLRTLVKEGYTLNRKKGTKWVVERIAEIILGEKIILMEKNQMQQKNQEDYYGKTIYDVTMLINHYVDEKKKSQLYFLLKQFLPVRCRMNIVYLNRRNMLDTYCYMDLNASLYVKETAVLDEYIYLDNNVMLKDEADTYLS